MKHGEHEHSNRGRTQHARCVQGRAVARTPPTHTHLCYKVCRMYRRGNWLFSLEERSYKIVYDAAVGEMKRVRESESSLDKTITRANASVGPPSLLPVWSLPCGPTRPGPPAPEALKLLTSPSLPLSLLLTCARRHKVPRVEAEGRADQAVSGYRGEPLAEVGQGESGVGEAAGRAAAAARRIIGVADQVAGEDRQAVAYAHHLLVWCVRTRRMRIGVA